VADDRHCLFFVHYLKFSDRWKHPAGKCFRC
jgi:hypothetical protein